MLKSVSWCEERDDDHLRLDCHHDHDQGLCPETLLAPLSLLLLDQLILQQEVHNHHDLEDDSDDDGDDYAHI